MKNIKQIREDFDLITEKEEKESRKLSTLVRAGLYDAKKLPALKKALEKSAEKMTSQERRMLLNLLDTLINQVVSDEQIYRKVKQNVQHVNEAKEDYLTKADPRFKSGYPSEKKMPTVLILKRKAIRVYPDNQKVALYYSQALDKYVTIPFGGTQLGLNEAIKRKITKLDKQAHQELDLDSDQVDLLHKRGEYENIPKRVASVAGRSNLGVGLGTALHDRRQRKKLMKKVEDKKAEIQSRPSEKSLSKQDSSTPKKQKSSKTTSTNTSSAILKVRSPSQTKTRMTAIKKKRPGAIFSSRAKKIAGIKESVQIDEALPLVPLAIAAGRVAAPHIARAAARYAPAVGRGLASAGRTALSKGKEWGKRALDFYKKRRAERDLKKQRGSGPKNRKKDNRKFKDKKGNKSRLANAAALTSLAGASGTGSSNEKSKTDITFSHKPTSISSKEFASKSDETQRMRDLRLARQSQAAMMREETVLSSLKNMVENKIVEQTFKFDKQEININNTVAKKILFVYESINNTNKKKMEKMLNENVESFNKVLSFAIRQ